MYPNFGDNTLVKYELLRISLSNHMVQNRQMITKAKAEKLNMKGVWEKDSFFKDEDKNLVGEPILECYGHQVSKNISHV